VEHQTTSRRKYSAAKDMDTKPIYGPWDVACKSLFFITSLLNSDPCKKSWLCNKIQIFLLSHFRIWLTNICISLKILLFRKYATDFQCKQFREFILDELILIVTQQVRNAGGPTSIRNIFPNGNVFQDRAQYVRHPSVGFTFRPIPHPTAPSSRSSSPANPGTSP